jgi:hypothetical protein
MSWLDVHWLALAHRDEVKARKHTAELLMNLVTARGQQS